MKEKIFRWKSHFHEDTHNKKVIVWMHTTKLILPRHKYAAAIASCAAEAPFSKLVFQPVTKITNGLLALKSGWVHSASGFVIGIGILLVLVLRMNDSDEISGVYFSGTKSELVFSAIEPFNGREIKMSFAINLVCFVRQNQIIYSQNLLINVKTTSSG